jgi:transposase-like protein
MRVRVIKRYSECFKRQVVEELERGRFASITEARLHHGIPGSTTVQKWITHYGRHHLQAKVVRVEKPDEQDRIRAYKKQVAQLEQALGKTQAENVLHATFLKLACEQLGLDVESFKKKFDGKPSIEPPGSGQAG